MSQKCTCESPETGHKANDCPVHNLYPLPSQPDSAPSVDLRQLWRALDEAVRQAEIAASLIPDVRKCEPFARFNIRQAVALLRDERDRLPAMAKDNPAVR